MVHRSKRTSARPLGEGACGHACPLVEYVGRAAVEIHVDMYQDTQMGVHAV